MVLCKCLLILFLEGEKVSIVSVEKLKDSPLYFWVQGGKEITVTWRNRSTMKKTWVFAKGSGMDRGMWKVTERIVFSKPYLLPLIPGKQTPSKA